MQAVNRYSWPKQPSSHTKMCGCITKEKKTSVLVSCKVWQKCESTCLFSRKKTKFLLFPLLSGPEVSNASVCHRKFKFGSVVQILRRRIVHVVKWCQYVQFIRSMSTSMNCERCEHVNSDKFGQLRSMWCALCNSCLSCAVHVTRVLPNGSARSIRWDWYPSSLTLTRALPLGLRSMLSCRFTYMLRLVNKVCD